MEEPRWHSALAVIVALALYVTLPNRVLVGPYWLLPLLTMVILVPLIIFSPNRVQETPFQRWLSLTTVILLNIFNLATIVLLFEWLLSNTHHRSFTGEQLLVTAVQIWITNVIVYALWYWEIDGHGPDYRSSCTPEERNATSDFLFPQQMVSQQLQQQISFRPRMWDYVFLSFNTATAFSPTDTFPITHAAKVLMMAESMTSLVTIAIIAGRAVNILGG